MPRGDFRPGEQHPDQWREDLNPDAMAGQNLGAKGPHPEQGARTAYDFKDVHERLRDMDDDVLKGVPILAEGGRPGAAYLASRDGLCAHLAVEAERTGAGPVAATGVVPPAAAGLVAVALLPSNGLSPPAANTSMRAVSGAPLPVAKKPE